MSCIDTALTVLFYHGGCYIEYLLKLHDGARVFPVHAVRCVQHYIHIMELLLPLYHCMHFCSGFWGVICVGIFSRTCLILEVYESLCYCVDNTLPSNVRTHVMHSIHGIGLFLFSKDTLCVMHTSCPWYVCHFCVQIESHGIRFVFQLLGGLFIVVWASVMIFLMFAILWYIPVKLALACLP